ncbi:MAG: HAD hydrolase-like protein [Ruminococcus sp.]|nr:HAD hydrolase-like protein [Ruminococcus sp.]
MIKIAVFDLDGTLVNSLTDLALSVNKGLKAAGLPEHPLSAYNRFVGNGRAKLIERAIGAERLTDALFDAVISVFDREYRLHCNDNTAAYDGCAGMLEALTKNGIATAVLSNKPDEFMGEILGRLYPNHRFLEAWGQKPQYKCKPDKEALHAMLGLHHIPLDGCVYIGDSDVDVLTAKNSGVKMAGVSWGFRGRKELLDTGAPYVADTAAELTEYLLSL